MRAHVVDRTGDLDPVPLPGQDLRRGMLSDDLETRSGIAFGDPRPDVVQKEKQAVEVRVVVDRPEEKHHPSVGGRIAGARMEVPDVHCIRDHCRTQRGHEGARARFIMRGGERHSVEVAPGLHFLPLQLRPVRRVVKAPHEVPHRGHLALQVELDIVLVQRQPRK